MQLYNCMLAPLVKLSIGCSVECRYFAVGQRVMDGYVGFALIQVVQSLIDDGLLAIPSADQFGRRLR